MSILEMIELIAIAIIIFGFLIWFLVKAVKNKWVDSLTDTMNTSIKEAEASGKSGSEKKIYVMKNIEIKCEELHIPYKLIFGLISKLIDIVIKNYNVISK